MKSGQMLKLKVNLDNIAETTTQQEKGFKT